MPRFGYTGEARYRPLTAWAYVGYTLLFAIPVIGFILLIVFSFSSGNINRRSFARSFWCFMLLGVIVLTLTFAVFNARMQSILTPENRVKWEQLKSDAWQYLTGILPFVRKEPPKLPEIGAGTQTSAVSSLLSKKTTSPPARPTDTPPPGISAEFKDAIDSLESFFDEYIAFMKKYTTSENVLGMVADYTSFMSRYEEAMKKMDQYDKQTLSQAEEAYYARATLRIHQKLLEFSSQE